MDTSQHRPVLKFLVDNTCTNCCLRIVPHALIFFSLDAISANLEGYLDRLCMTRASKTGAAIYRAAEYRFMTLELSPLVKEGEVDYDRTSGSRRRYMTRWCVDGGELGSFPRSITRSISTRKRH